MNAVVWQSIVIGLMLAIGFSVGVFRFFTQPRPSYSILVKTHDASIPLLVVRAAAISLFLAVLILRLDLSDFFDLAYYTYWNFTLQTIYFVAAVVAQVRTWHGRPSLQANQPLNALFDVCFASCILVVLVYWFVLYDPTVPLLWTTCVVHGANLVFLVVDFCLNDHLVQRINFKFVIMWPAIYGAVTWIGNATYLHGFWPYKLLDVSANLAPLKWLGILVGHAFGFGVALLLSAWKKRVAAAVAPSGGAGDDDTTNVHIKVVPTSLV
ncbi:Aste57867_20098 [Aphanomyces stellatus]|uniref:Aste57867_20098 protein n=1 Tax=Aphanomyces stellatus TaxID=120398 RepID=A0A485LE60_9STRA|nr:hypothetical protein As57867_020032 [Aphanomyces stellatus]VFT96793.1 Aste57867_20098 [Aphanomyces stellatus]